VLEELAARRELHHEEDPLLRVQDLPEPHDVRVLEQLEDLDLAADALRGEAEEVSGGRGGARAILRAARGVARTSISSACSIRFFSSTLTATCSLAILCVAFTTVPNVPSPSGVEKT